MELVSVTSGDVANAEDELRDALREFMAPRLPVGSPAHAGDLSALLNAGFRRRSDGRAARGHPLHAPGALVFHDPISTPSPLCISAYKRLRKTDDVKPPPPPSQWTFAHVCYALRRPRNDQAHRRDIPQELQPHERLQLIHEALSILLALSGTPNISAHFDSVHRLLVSKGLQAEPVSACRVLVEASQYRAAWATATAPIQQVAVPDVTRVQLLCWRGIAAWRLDDKKGSQEDFAICQQRAALLLDRADLPCTERAQVLCALARITRLEHPCGHDDAQRIYTEVLRLCNEARAADASIASISYAIEAEAHHINGKFELCLDAATRAIDIDPLTWDAYSWRAASRLRFDDYDSALADCVRVLERIPTHCLSLQTRAAALRSLGRLEEARTGGEAAVDANPKNAHVHANLARVYEQLKENENALQAAQRALELQKTNKFAQCVLNRLNGDI